MVFHFNGLAQQISSSFNSSSHSLMSYLSYFVFVTTALVYCDTHQPVYFVPIDLSKYERSIIRNIDGSFLQSSNWTRSTPHHTCNHSILSYHTCNHCPANHTCNQCPPNHTCNQCPPHHQNAGEVHVCRD